MATFHPFPRLPLELRIQIWQLCTSQNRIIRFSSLSSTGILWHPSPAPAITRVCLESRKYCTYTQTPSHFSSPDQYIWLDLSTDIIQMDCSIAHLILQSESLENLDLQHIRIVVEEHAEEYFYHFVSHLIRNFPMLTHCDILVYTGLYKWCSGIKEEYWGDRCPRGNVRFIDAKTGEWIDEVLAPAWEDWWDTGRGERRCYCRIADWEVDDEDGLEGWDEEDREWLVEQRRERERAMLEVGRRGLPRMELGG